MRARWALLIVLLGYIGVAIIEPCEDSSGHSCKHAVRK